MERIALYVDRDALAAGLRTLGAIRRKRFASVVPVWLRFDPAKSQLAITEARRGVTAVVEARGAWSPAGATLDMFALRRVVEALEASEVELILTPDQILIPTARGHVQLRMQAFGPESRRSSTHPPGP